MYTENNIMFLYVKIKTLVANLFYLYLCSNVSACEDV